MSRYLFGLAFAATLSLSPSVFGQGPTPGSDAAKAQIATPVNEPLFVESYVAPGPQVWARGEYVFWSIGTGKLVEMGLNSYNSDLFNSLLDAAGKDYKDFSEFLLGDDRTGYRLSAGAWLDSEQTLGVEAAFLYVNRGPLELNIGQRDLSPLARIIPDRTVTLDPASRIDREQARKRLIELIRNSDRIDRPLRTLILLSRFGVPAINSRLQPIVVPFGARDLVDASLKIEIAEQTFWVADVLGRGRIMQSEGMTVNALVGYRSINYQDNLRVHSQVTTLSRPLLPGTQLNSFDSVQTNNTLDGAFLGAELQAESGPWSFSFRPSATIAYMRNEVERDGLTTITLPDRRRLGIQAGSYLLSSDLGTYATQGWTVIPEVTFGAARAFGDNFRLTFGSSLLYLPEAARAAAQFEFGLDPSRTGSDMIGTRQSRNVIPPDLRAVFLSTFSVGLEVRY